MIKRKFAGKQSLFHALFPYIESELKNRLELQSSGFNGYNKNIPTLEALDISYEEDSKS